MEGQYRLIPDNLSMDHAAPYPTSDPFISSSPTPLSNYSSSSYRSPSIAMQHNSEYPDTSSFRNARPPLSRIVTAANRYSPTKRSSALGIRAPAPAPFVGTSLNWPMTAASSLPSPLATPKSNQFNLPSSPIPSPAPTSNDVGMIDAYATPAPNRFSPSIYLVTPNSNPVSLQTDELDPTSTSCQSPTVRTITPPLTPPFPISPPLPTIQLIQSPPLELHSTLSARLLSNYPLHPLFASSYTILDQELGSGGFGFVVKARRETDGTTVAVKFLYRTKV